MITDGLEDTKIELEILLGRNIFKEEGEKLDSSMEDEGFYIENVFIYHLPKTLATFKLKKMEIICSK